MYSRVCVCVRERYRVSVQGGLRTPDERTRNPLLFPFPSLTIRWSVPNDTVKVLSPTRLVPTDVRPPPPSVVQCRRVCLPSCDDVSGPLPTAEYLYVVRLTPFQLIAELPN